MSYINSFFLYEGYLTICDTAIPKPAQFDLQGQYSMTLTPLTNAKIQFTENHHNVGHIFKHKFVIHLHHIGLISKLIICDLV